MKVPVYSIRDVLNGFTTPILDINDQTAKRNFAYAVNNNPNFSFSPKDYDLYRLGEFDQDTGFFNVVLPVLICHGTDVVGVGSNEE